MNSYAKMVGAAAIITAFLGLDRFVYAVYLPGLLPKYWWFALMLAMIPLLWWYKNRIPAFLLAPFTLWSLAYLVLICTYGALNTRERAAPEISTQILAFGAAVGVSFVFYCCSPSYLRKVFWIVGILLIATVGLEFVFPNNPLAQSARWETYIPGRPSGTLLNPNVAAEASLLCLLLCIPWRETKVQNVLTPLLLLVACITFSRAGMVAALLFAVLALASRQYPKVWAGGFLALALSVAAFPSELLDSIATSVGNEAAAENAAMRIRSITKRQFYDGSTSERTAELDAAIEAFEKEPLLGAGAATTRLSGVGPHNQLAMLLGEFGLLGGAFWLALALMIGSNVGWFGWPERAMWLALFLVMSAATHNMFENQYWILAFAYYLRPAGQQGAYAPIVAVRDSARMSGTVVGWDIFPDPRRQ